MAINRATYYQAPPPDVSYKATPAYEYASIFLKNRANQWELSLKQAASEIADKSQQNKLLIDAYKRHQSDLQDSLDNINKLIAGVQQGDQKSILAVSKLNEDIKNKNDIEAMRWAQLKGEMVNVPFSSSISERSGYGAGGGGPRSSQQSADAEVINLARGNVGADPVALAREVERSGVSSGMLDQTNKSRADSARSMTVESSIQDGTSALLNQNPSMDPATARNLAQTEVYQRLDSSGLHSYVASHESSETPAIAGGGGGASRSSSVGGAVQRPKYNLPESVPQGEEGTVKISPTDLTYLTDQQKSLADQLASLKPPDVSDIDWITRSREIMAGRFGPVMPAPNYYARNVVSQLQGSTDDQIKLAYDTWKASRATAAGAPASVTPTVAPPVAPTAPISAGEPPVASPSETDITNRLQSTVSPAASGMDTMQNQTTRASYPIRQKELDALFPSGVPQAVMDAAQRIGLRNPPVTGPTAGPDVSGFRARGAISGGEPTYTQLPGLKTVAPEKETSGVGSTSYTPTSQLMPSKQPGGKVTFDTSVSNSASTYTPSSNQPSVMKYYTNRVLEAKNMASDPSVLQSAVKSGAGKVAADIYRANAASGQPFLKTYETITMTFAGDPDNMAKAHTAALALDMSANNKKAPPKE